MKRLAAMVGLTVSLLAAPASAQDAGGYLTAGAHYTYGLGSSAYGQGTLGVTVGFADNRVRAGGQADLMWSWPYFAGRGGPVIEFAPVRGRVRPYLTAGKFWGEDDGMMAGVGVDLEITRNASVRVFYQDVFRKYNYSDEYFHTPAIQAGFAWR